jgi:hypothetical protein
MLADPLLDSAYALKLSAERKPRGSQQAPMIVRPSDHRQEIGHFHY